MPWTSLYHSSRKRCSQRKMKLPKWEVGKGARVSDSPMLRLNGDRQCMVEPRCTRTRASYYFCYTYTSVSGQPAANLEYRFSTVEGRQYGRLPARAGNDCSTPANPIPRSPFPRTHSSRSELRNYKSPTLCVPLRMILRNALIVGCTTSAFVPKYRMVSVFNDRRLIRACL